MTSSKMNAIGEDRSLKISSQVVSLPVSPVNFVVIYIKQVCLPMNPFNFITSSELQKSIFYYISHNPLRVYSEVSFVCLNGTDLERSNFSLELINLMLFKRICAGKSLVKSFPQMWAC